MNDMQMIDPKAETNLLYVSQLAFDQMQRIPTVDAVPVLRCKDCKHYYRPLNWPEDYTKGECEIDLLDRRVHPDDFCSYGKRKEADGNG